MKLVDDTKRESESSDSDASSRGVLRVLVVEDEDDDVTLLLREIRRGGYTVDFKRVQTADDLRSALLLQNASTSSSSAWDIVISDWSLPTFDGMSAFRIVREHDPDLPFIMVSATMDEDRAVEALRAGVHDFMVKGRFARLVPAIQRELGEATSRRQSRRNASLVANLSDVALEAYPFDPIGCVEDAIDVLAQEAREKNLVLRVVVASDVPRVAIGDAGRLRQILLNLIGNALKFTPSGSGEVVVSVHIGDANSGGEMPLSFEVRDTGIGIADELRARLFQPPTNLGLAISKRLCERMGGEITVESAVGKGTTFRFSVCVGVSADMQPVSKTRAALRRT